MNNQPKETTVKFETGGYIREPDRLDLLSYFAHWIIGLFLILVFLGIAAFSAVRFFIGAGTDGLIVSGICGLIAGLWFWRVKP